jgi:hypothetical protein
MINALLALTIPLQAKLDLPMGYYTMAMLGARLQAQQIPVSIDSSCAGDIYAIRAKNRTWPELSKAFAADDRLIIRSEGNRWRIERSLKEKTTSQQATRRYLSAAAASIYSIYGPVARITRNFEGMSPDARNARYEAWSASSGKDTLSNRIHDLVYLQYSGEVSYGLVSIAAALTAPGRDIAFNQPRKARLTEWLPMILPTGALRDLKIMGVDPKTISDEELGKVVQTLQLNYALTIDPLTMATQCSAMAFSVDAAKMIFIGSRDLSIYKMPPDVRPGMLWDQTYVESLATRAKQTDLVLEDPNLKIDAKLPAHELRTSEALLRCADRADIDMVYHVPSFSDYVVTPGPTNLSAVVATVNAGKIDQSWLDQTAKEESGTFTTGLKEPLTLPKRLSVIPVGGCLVVRNEMGFLDTLSSSDGGAPSLDNPRLFDQPAKFEVLQEHVRKMNISAWPTALFSSNYLQYCNPLSFRPYAALTAESPVLRKGLAEVGVGKSVSFTFDTIGPRAKAAFLTAMGESAYKREISASGASGFFERVKETNLRIRIARSVGRYRFILEQALPSTFPERTGKAFEWDEIPRWSCWIQNVDCSL